MEFKKTHLIGICLGIIIILFSLLVINSKFFFLMVGIGILIAVLPFIFIIINENKIDREKEEMFLEFARNLVESVKTGTPISKSITNVRNKSYGILSENIDKLANQINLGIPLNTALNTFSMDVKNKTISRALTLIGHAEKAGGEIGEILESVAEAVNMSDKLKKERKAAISTLVVQGYIIFLVFIAIVLIMQIKILPMISGIADANIFGDEEKGKKVSSNELSNAFLYLLLVQGFFSGLVIGKLSGGNVKQGIKHSFALMFLSFFFSTIANLFLVQ
jgi:flagellar protein FlaJ